jgi:hypothetical protein
MEEEKLKERTSGAPSQTDWETWDNWNEDLEKALPNWDRWNNDLKQLLPDEEKPVKQEQFEEMESATPEKKPEPTPSPVEPVKEIETKPAAAANEGKISELPRRQESLNSDKQLLFFIQKFKKADKICKEAGISLRTLQDKVGYLSYKLKRYIEVEDLYRETSPVKLTVEGIHISRSHLIETGFEVGDRFKVDFKDKYIVLSKLQKPNGA